MILVDESRLTKGCLGLIGDCYDVHYNHYDETFDEDSYQEYLDSIVEKLWFDIDDYNECIKKGLEWTTDPDFKVKNII